MIGKDTPRTCVCGCGQPVPPHAHFASPACVLRCMLQDEQFAASIGRHNIQAALKRAESRKNKR